MYNMSSVAHMVQEGHKSQRDKALFLQHICREGKQLSQQHINQHLLVINLFPAKVGRRARGSCGGEECGAGTSETDQRFLTGERSERGNTHETAGEVFTWHLSADRRTCQRDAPAAG